MRLPPPDTQPITARLAGTGSLRRELEAVLAAASPLTGPAEIRDLVLKENVAGKGSAAARAKTWERLKARYVLDPATAEYQAFLAGMRATTSPSERGLLCFLMLARNDRLFREIVIEHISPHLNRDGIVIQPEEIEATIRIRAETSGFRWTGETMTGVRQHLLSALRDFGVLRGSRTKHTVRPRLGPAVALFAARLGRLENLSDRQVLESRWYRLLGLSPDDAVDLLQSAQRSGVLTLRMQADVVELTLPPIQVS